MSASTLLVAVLFVAQPEGDGLRSARSQEGALELFEAKVRPVLVERCYRCHSAAAPKLRGGLFLDSRDGFLRGGESGPAVVPGDPASSMLLVALRHEGVGPEMPPDGKLPEDVIAVFERWVAMGAPAPDPGDGSAAAPSTAEGDDGTLWSLRPPRRHAPPPVRDARWCRSPVDAFILSALESRGLAPSPPAPPAALARRAALDITGLPPAPEELDAFLADPSPDAYERWVDRLLASPHFGERWARLWLDVARYAEDQAHIVGDDRSLFYPNAYLYRDWVIGALNADMPYDEFVRRQLAADAIDPDEPAAHAALGFLGLGPKYYGRGSAAVMADEWEDRIDVVTRGLLGLTVACARCHDHKYDPISTEDYYALAGIFASTEMYNRPLDASRKTKKDGQAESSSDALHIVRDGKPRNLPVFARGKPTSEGEPVRRRFIQALAAGTPQPFEHGSGRLELADEILRRDNPLAARVFVNRVWGAMFGRALVATPSNFGSLGERPSHPELLDDLAVRFLESGGSLKRLVRELALSAAYRQASLLEPEAARADPENRLLSRMNRRRLSVEAWRDSVLSASGRLDRAVGGPSIDPDDPDAARRTLYSRVSRLELEPMLVLFDFPDPNVHAARRVETTTPLQKLFSMNSPFMVRQAAALAERLEAEVPGGGRARVERAYRVLFARTPDPAELDLALAFLGKDGDSSAGRWRQYAQALLMANELLFVD